MVPPPGKKRLITIKPLSAKTEKFLKECGSVKVRMWVAPVTIDEQDCLVLREKKAFVRRQMMEKYISGLDVACVKTWATFARDGVCIIYTSDLPTTLIRLNISDENPKIRGRISFVDYVCEELAKRAWVYACLDFRRNTQASAIYTQE